MVASWPFAVYGMDMIGPIKYTASNSHRFILVTIDYFTKWVKVAFYANITQRVVRKFIEKDIICRYRLPKTIITDNAQNFNGFMV